MPSHLEPVTWILRAGPQMLRHGDPYQVSAVVLSVEPGVVRVVGMTGRLYPGFLREVKDLARQMGLKRVIWERRKGEGFETVTMEINNDC